MSRLDLSDQPIVDVHLHGFEVSAILEERPEDWENLITLMGMCFLSSKSVDQALADTVSSMSESTVFARLSRRWVADLLGCSIERLPEERLAKLRNDPHSYLSSLMKDQNITDLFVDDGYPLPRVDQDVFEDHLGTRIHKVCRIEPYIEEAREQTASVREFEEFFRTRLEATAEDPRAVAYKTVIAYRTGLDIGAPDRDEVAASYERWKAAGWRDGRDTSKPLRDHLLNVTYEVAGAQGGRPIHIHSGAGDPDNIVSYARPTGLIPLLKRFPSQPTVLIHSGYPWIDEGAYIASMYPHAYLDVSLFVPWATLDIDRILTTALGSVPTTKVMYGSDEASEPEVIWVSARLFRAALERVLSRAMDIDHLTLDDAHEIGADILSRNALRLHGLDH